MSKSRYLMVCLNQCIFWKANISLSAWIASLGYKIAHDCIRHTNRLESYVSIYSKMCTHSSVRTRTQKDPKRAGRTCNHKSLVFPQQIGPDLKAENAGNYAFQLDCLKSPGFHLFKSWIQFFPMPAVQWQTEHAIQPKEPTCLPQNVVLATTKFVVQGMGSQPSLGPLPLNSSAISETVQGMENLWTWCHMKLLAKSMPNRWKHHLSAVKGGSRLLVLRYPEFHTARGVQHVVYMYMHTNGQPYVFVPAFSLIFSDRGPFHDAMKSRISAEHSRGLNHCDSSKSVAVSSDPTLWTTTASQK